jgi:hypothetical protein
MTVYWAGTYGNAKERKDAATAATYCAGTGTSEHKTQFCNSPLLYWADVFPNSEYK